LNEDGANEGCGGCFSKIDILDDEHYEIIDFAFSELAGSTLAADEGCQQSQLSFENFMSAVVAGAKYKFDLIVSEECFGTTKKCSMEVFDQSWTQTREVLWENVVCTEVVKECIWKEVEELDTGNFKVGGFEYFDVLSPEQQVIVDFAFSELEGSTEGSSVAGKVICDQSEVSVENFSEQLVAGTNYGFDLVLSKKCTGKAMRCNMVVYDVPWEGTREVTWEQVTCFEEEESGGFENFGDFEKVDDLKAEFQEMVIFAIGKLAGSEEGKIAAGGEYIICSNLEIERIENFKTQIVAGINYAFDLILSEECTRIDEDTPGTAKRCSMVVYDQSWTQTREVSWEKVKCTDL